MKAKSLVTVALLAFVGLSVACLIIQESGSGPALQSETEQSEIPMPQPERTADTRPAQEEPVAQTDHRLMAYYFHRTQRCRTCLTIEAYAEEALKGAFPKALETGELEWRTANLDEPANEHFVEDYQLAASSLVLVDTQGGEQKGWRNLERVWELVGDELKFKAYVEAAVLNYLEEEDP